MNTVNELKKVLDSKRPLDPVTTKSLQDDFMLRYNQASNAIARLLKDSVQRSIERELQVIYPQWQKDYPKLAYEVAKKKEIAEKKPEISLNKEQERTL